MIQTLILQVKYTLLLFASQDILELKYFYRYGISQVDSYRSSELVITAENLFAKFRPVHGNPSNIQGTMQLAEMHRHMGGGRDTTTPSWRALRALTTQGVDIVAVTNHNHRGHTSVSRTRDWIRAIGGKHIEIIDGVEVTAKSHLHPGEDRHVLVYNAPNIRRLQVFMPLPRLLAEAADQGAETFLAHPSLGSNMSVTPDEVDDLTNRGLPFGLEVHNGGAAQIDSWSSYVTTKSANPLFSFIAGRLPQTGANDIAKELAQTYELPGLGGGDQHGEGQSFVLNCFPQGMTVFEAIKRGVNVVMESNSVPRPLPWELAVGHVRGKLSARRVDRKVQRLQRRFFSG
jgi:hypothetical protein